VTDKYTIIAAEKANYAVRSMCRWLEVSTSGFYDWASRPPSATRLRNARLAVLVKAAFDASRGTYGARRVHAELTRNGEQLGVKLVALMAGQGLAACQPRPYKRTTVASCASAAAPDLVGRDFTAAAPGVKLVGDITYVRTWAGWLYLATVIDCFSRRVVGWSMPDHMRTSLISDALTMAAGNITLQPECVFHSDRGSQYTAAESRRILAVHRSKRRSGEPGFALTGQRHTPVGV